MLIMSYYLEQVNVIAKDSLKDGGVKFGLWVKKN